MRALHALGAASYIREQYERALHLEYRALRLSRAGEYRWRVWADLGNVLIGLGTYDLARRVFVLVAGHTEQELLRWGCTYSLLEIGSLRQDHDVIERYAPTLLATAAFPYQQAHAYGLLGDCYQRRGDTKTAREYFRRAIAVAEEHGIQQLAFQSQESLQRSVESLPPSSSLVLDGIEMELHSAEMTARG
jgi:tetratricopeptide (TPR) repeat protein